MSKKILVVDDEKDVQFLFQQRFRREIRNEEMKFAFAFSGEEALEYLDNNPQEAVLILSDINMPGMSGLELQERLMFKNISIPIIMVTGFADEEERNIALHRNAVAVLDKPYTLNELLGCFNQLNVAIR